mmetsp:Transcript_14010/g.33966  ORF Transcript_14010/g.33966 Transcript_14010/m.33966 type:complete len:228 (-) Transcript_14010:19-702(-)
MRRVVHDVPHVLLVLDPVDKPLAFSRRWCMFEALCALLCGGSVSLCAPEGDHQRIMVALETKREELMGLVSEIDMASTRSSSDADATFLASELDLFFKLTGTEMRAQVMARANHMLRTDLGRSVTAFTWTLSGTNRASVGARVLPTPPNRLLTSHVKKTGVSAAAGLKTSEVATQRQPPTSGRSEAEPQVLHRSQAEEVVTAWEPGMQYPSPGRGEPAQRESVSAEP